MTTNASAQFYGSQERFRNATTSEEKLKALQEMYQLAPKHKSSEKLLSEIKAKISKYKQLATKEKQAKKSGKSLGIRKEGAAQITIIGLTNTGKSTLLNKITNIKTEVAPYKFTTKKPVIGTLDYKGVKIQIIEIPAIVENYIEQPNGPTNLSVVRQCDLIIITYKTDKDIELVKNELKANDIYKEYILYQEQDDIADEIWLRLGLIKVYTKQPGKKPTYPPIAFKKGTTVRALAEVVHKDILDNFKFARIWGKSVKHASMRYGLNHVLKDEDIVELHAK